MTAPRDPRQQGSPPGSGRPGVPRPLAVALVVAAVEAVGYAGFGLSLLISFQRQRAVMDVTTTLFFVGYGGFLALCALQLRRLRAWARAPLVMAQLIQVVVATWYWEGATRPVAVVLLVAGALVLVGIFHPRSLAAVEGADQGES